MFGNILTDKLIDDGNNNDDDEVMIIFNEKSTPTLFIIAAKTSPFTASLRNPEMGDSKQGLITRSKHALISGAAKAFVDTNLNVLCTKYRERSCKASAERLGREVTGEGGEGVMMEVDCWRRFS